MVAEIELRTGTGNGRGMNDLVLGIDGGGSKTLVMLADRSGQIVQKVRTGGINPLDNPSWRRDLEAIAAGLGACGSFVHGHAAKADRAPGHQRLNADTGKSRQSGG